MAGHMGNKNCTKIAVKVKLVFLLLFLFKFVGLVFFSKRKVFDLLIIPSCEDKFLFCVVVVVCSLMFLLYFLACLFVVCFCFLLLLLLCMFFVHRLVG